MNDLSGRHSSIAPNIIINFHTSESKKKILNAYATKSALLKTRRIKRFTYSRQAPAVAPQY